LEGEVTLGDIERCKLRANALDRASTACLTIGVLAPIAASIYAAPNPTANYWLYGLSVIGWFLAALTLHYWSYATLRKIDI
jgi:hypothetical protein